MAALLLSPVAAGGMVRDCWNSPLVARPVL